jgi:hypothetical protein
MYPKNGTDIFTDLQRSVHGATHRFTNGRHQEPSLLPSNTSLSTSDNSSI